MIDIFRNDDVREHPFSGQRFLDGLRRRRRFHDALMALASFRVQYQKVHVGI